MGYLIAFMIYLLCNHARVFAYSTGASVLECETMSPGLCHGGVAQSGAHGYTIKFVASTGFYGNGDSYQGKWCELFSFSQLISRICFYQIYARCGDSCSFILSFLH